MSSSSITPAEERPTWRGWLHVGAFMLSIPAGVLLILAADHASARVAASIYAASLLLGFGTSAGYHRLARRERTQAIMQRLDHSMIFVLIAGSYTPVCLLGLPTSWGIPLLCVPWLPNSCLLPCMACSAPTADWLLPTKSANTPSSSWRFCDA